METKGFFLGKGCLLVHQVFIEQLQYARHIVVLVPVNMNDCEEDKCCHVHRDKKHWKVRSH